MRLQIQHQKLAAKQNIKSQAQKTQDRKAQIAALRQLIDKTERRTSERGDRQAYGSPHSALKAATSPITQQDAEKNRWAFGLAEIDATLPESGLRTDGLHEIVPKAHGDRTAALGFGLAILKQHLAGRETKQHHKKNNTIIWCQQAFAASELGSLYTHGITYFGIDPGAILFVQVTNNTDGLWVLEEALNHAGIAAVIGEIDKASFTQTRRLALAAAKNKTPILIIRDFKETPATAASTRWHVKAVPSAMAPLDHQAPGDTRWHINLSRCKGGRADQAESQEAQKKPASVKNSWIVEWRHETHHFALVPRIFSQLPRNSTTSPHNLIRLRRQKQEPAEQNRWAQEQNIRPLKTVSG